MSVLFRGVFHFLAESRFSSRLPTIQMNLCISRYWLKVAWVWMKKGDTEGVVTADTLSALLGFISEMVSPGTRGRKKNTLRFGP